MKKLVSLSALVLLFGTVSMLAKDFTAIACTADHKSAVLAFSLEDDDPIIAGHVKTAFQVAAKDLTFAALLTEEGWENFVAGLSQADVDDMTAITLPTTDGSSCKAAN